jgi:hypothetical protein
VSIRRAKISLLNPLATLGTLSVLSNPMSAAQSASPVWTMAARTTSSLRHIWVAFWMVGAAISSDNGLGK